ncbi:MAG: AAA family ATPase [bacterium]
MIKIDEIKVKNFKNIENATIKFDKYNLIVGSNNSGKSNLLMVFRFLNFIINDSIDIVKNSFEQEIPIVGYIKPYYFYKKDVLEIELKFSDNQKKLLYNYVIRIQWEEKDGYDFTSEIIKESFSVKSFNKPGKASTIFLKIKDKITYGGNFANNSFMDSGQKHVSVVRILNPLPPKSNPYYAELSVLDYIIKSQIYYFSNIGLNSIDIKERKDFYGRITSYDFIKEIKKIENTPKFEILKSILNKMLNISDLQIMERNEIIENSNNFFIVITQFNHQKLFSGLSDGSILLISLITKILTSEHSIFLIEEPENSLHPKALVDLINFIKSFINEKQFIIVTHSLTLLNTSNPNDVIIAELQENGLSNITNIPNPKEISRRLKNSFSAFSDFVFFADKNEEEFE